jgi:tetratricopeptide (TPR) repeat protein
MTAGDDKQAALIPAQSKALAKTGASSLAARGRNELRIREQKAEEWLRKGLKLLDAAPDDPRVRGPINQYAIRPIPDLCAQLQMAVKYINQVLAGGEPGAVARSLNMTRDEVEIAHVAYFFLPEALEAVIGRLAAPRVKTVEDRASGTGLIIPSPNGMDEGVLTQKTADLMVQISLELDRVQQRVCKREESLREAFRSFEAGHELDPWNPELLYWLAESYRYGHGVEENEEKALALHQRAADMGYAEAQTAIGDAYSQCGFSRIPENLKEAAKWYQFAAEQGEEEALGLIVEMYQRGKGVKQDHAEAARLLRNAVARGDETAKHNLRISAERFGPPYDDRDRYAP